MLINNMPGLALSTTNAASGQILNGYTAYNGEGELLTGSLMSTAITANANTIMNGFTAYNELGQLLTGTASSGYSQIWLGVSSQSTYGGQSLTINCGFRPSVVMGFARPTINQYIQYNTDSYYFVYGFAWKDGSIIYVSCVYGNSGYRIMYFYNSNQIANSIVFTPNNTGGVLSISNGPQLIFMDSNSGAGYTTLALA